MNEGKRVKTSEELCKTCQYSMSLTGARVMFGNGVGVTCCGFSLKTGKSRVFSEGHKKATYEPGYCNYYIPGKRLRSIDSMVK